MRRIILLFVAVFISVFFFGCEKEKQIPQIATSPVSDVTSYSCITGGEVLDEGDAKVTARGICWSNEHFPTIADNKTIVGEGDGSFTSTATGLKSNTTYYIRAFASNRFGTAYGDVISFITAYDGEIVNDIDGNLYHTVTIGTQVWLVENLKVSRFRNGDSVSYIADSLEWGNYGGTSPRLCIYDNYLPNVGLYGYLYNQDAANDSRGLAPEGWHIPTVAEFQTLIDYLGGESLAGGGMKEFGFTHWVNPNLGAGNESGFTALPAGHRSVFGVFEGMGGICDFATCQTNWFLRLSSNNANALVYFDSKAMGASVRCVKDNK